jgi:purine-nucleoside phosphorylase
MASTWDMLEQAAALVKRRFSARPRFGLVLGSGLGFLAEKIEQPVVVNYSELPGFPVSTVEGHMSRLVLGELSGRPVAVMQGRFHYYEGYSMERVVMGVRLLARLGVEALITTNAAGAVNKAFRPGDLMLITDHINLMGNNPLIGPNLERLGPRFPDMSDAYCRELRELALKVAVSLGLELKQGVYAAMTGPSYETPAEIRMLRTLGADAVGMSTIPEVIAAVHAGLKVLGLSCISNLAAGLSERPLSHQEVKDTADGVREPFSRLVMELLRNIP